MLPSAERWQSFIGLDLIEDGENLKLVEINGSNFGLNGYKAITFDRASHLRMYFENYRTDGVWEFAPAMWKSWSDKMFRFLSTKYISRDPWVERVYGPLWQDFIWRVFNSLPKEERQKNIMLSPVEVVDDYLGRIMKYSGCTVFPTPHGDVCHSPGHDTLFFAEYLEQTGQPPHPIIPDGNYLLPSAKMRCARLNLNPLDEVLENKWESLPLFPPEGLPRARTSHRREIRRLLRESDATHFIEKPLTGKCGRGIEVYSRRDVQDILDDELFEAGALLEPLVAPPPLIPNARCMRTGIVLERDRDRLYIRHLASYWRCSMQTFDPEDSTTVIVNYSRGAFPMVAEGGHLQAMQAWLAKWACHLESLWGLPVTIETNFDDTWKRLGRNKNVSVRRVWSPWQSKIIEEMQQEEDKKVLSALASYSDQTRWNVQYRMDCRSMLK